MNEDEKGFEMISNTIEYYTRLQRIKAANTCNNDVLDYEIRAIELKLRSFGVDFSELKLVQQDSKYLRIIIKKGEVSFPFLLLGIRKKLPVEGHVGFKHNAIGYKLYYLIE